MINFEYLSCGKITEIRTLQTKKMRQKKGLTFIEGLKAVDEAVSTIDNIKYIVFNEKSTEELQLAQKYATEKQIPCFLLGEYDFKDLTLTKTPQNIIAVVKSPENISLQEVFDAKPAKILILDRIQDMGNVGTLVRSAAAFGVDYIINIKGTVEIANPKVIRAAAGLLWKMKFSFDNSIEDLIEQLQFNEFQVLIADKSGESYKKFQPKEPYALVLSNEGNGLSAEFRSVLEPQQSPEKAQQPPSSSAYQPISQLTVQSVPQVDSQPVSQHNSQPAHQAASQHNSQPAHQAASQQISTSPDGLSEVKSIGDDFGLPPQDLDTLEPAGLVRKSHRWHKISIQHSPQVESLNVAVAGSIILAQLSKQF